MTDLRMYRHRGTGLLQRLSPRVAIADPLLEEVADDAKPLAYVPITEEAKAALAASEPSEPEKGKEKK